MDNGQIIDAFISNCHTKIRLGTNTQFWNDVWIGNVLLSVIFPSLFWLIIDKHGSILKVCSCLNDVNVDFSYMPNALWRRHLRVNDASTL